MTIDSTGPDATDQGPPTAPPAGDIADRRGAVIGDGSRRGRALCRALSAVTDEWLGSVYASATDLTPAPALALVAVGGYGRGSWRPVVTSTCGSSTVATSTPRP